MGAVQGETIDDPPGSDRWHPCDPCVTGLNANLWKALLLDAMTVGCGSQEIDQLAATCHSTALSPERVLTGWL